MESSSQPIGISEYELEKFYPEKLEGVIPTIEEIEAKLNEYSNNYAGGDQVFRASPKHHPHPSNS